ncbi:hypothetical protein LOK49_LG03G02561 [Camellia lanceoleosa]|uniref:Uncharacterized protein n=1 Tax=Camellia lanceoleosa TaxID=1840588 RepID=A0ACC0IEM5_9ERIC|nr:hypothetical protein LOK49_LG03G02561 [Camellia lanceoleosa]
MTQKHLRSSLARIGKPSSGVAITRILMRTTDTELGLVEGMEKLEHIFSHDGKAVDDLLNVAKTLRAIPMVVLETPTPTLGGPISPKIVVDDAKRTNDSLIQEVTRLRQQVEKSYPESSTPRSRVGSHKGSDQVTYCW